MPVGWISAAARTVDRGDEVLQLERAGDRLVFGRAGHVPLGHGAGAVVDGDREAVVGDVEGEVLAHHRQTDQADLRLGHRGNLRWRARWERTPRSYAQAAQCHSEERSDEEPRPARFSTAPGEA